MTPAPCPVQPAAPQRARYIRAPRLTPIQWFALRELMSEPDANGERATYGEALALVLEASRETGGAE